MIQFYQYTTQRLFFNVASFTKLMHGRL